jgi:hypothetical protein
MKGENPMRVSKINIMRQTNLFALILILVFLSAASAFGFSVNVGPPSVYAVSKAGETTSGNIFVENNSDFPITVNAYTEDWLYAPDGSKNFLPAGSTKLSCSNWITVFPSTLTLEPKTRQDVTYSINVPANSTGGHYSVIFFESKLGERKGEIEGSTVMLAARIGTIVYHSTEGVFNQKGEISNFITSMSDPDKPLLVSFALKNLGDVYLGADGTAVIFDSSGSLVAREKVNKVNTLPGDEVKGKVSFLSGLPEGSYKLVLTLDYGTDSPMIVEKKFDIYKDNPYINKVNTVISNKTIKVFADARNPRSLPVTLSGIFNVENDKGKSFLTLPVESFEISGLGKRLIQNSFAKNLPPGEYKISLTLNEFHTKETTFTIK